MKSKIKVYNDNHKADSTVEIHKASSADDNSMQRTTKPWAVMLVLFCTIIMSFSQILWKIGSASLGLDIFKALADLPLVFGFLLYGLCAVLLIFALRGGDLSTLYPVLALSFVLTNLLAWLILGEDINLFKWIGIFSIVAGISFIGIGSRNSHHIKNRGEAGLP
ncbi:EamA family transporter [Candidatus Woesearchaeota archaeon]|nr:EamA family transporter [Candidatus Woesearchaeota archaeon]